MPDWKDAPEWAQWLACDADGTWYWFEDRPIKGACGYYSYGGKMANAQVPTLYKRPA